MDVRTGMETNLKKNCMGYEVVASHDRPCAEVHVLNVHVTYVKEGASIVI